MNRGSNWLVCVNTVDLVTETHTKFVSCAMVLDGYHQQKLQRLMPPYISSQWSKSASRMCHAFPSSILLPPTRSTRPQSDWLIISTLVLLPKYDFLVFCLFLFVLIRELLHVKWRRVVRKRTTEDHRHEWKQLDLDNEVAYKTSWQMRARFLVTF